jgi:hypothetical protein
MAKQTTLIEINGKFYPSVVEVADEPITDIYENISYDDLAEMFIAERYTTKKEIAIQRQKDEKPEEFAEYYAYCEQCKLRAKEIKNVKE